MAVAAIAAPSGSLLKLINPTERQREFLEMTRTKDYVLYGGAAGGGKSYSLRWAMVALLLRWRDQGLRGVRVGLFCEDYPSLRERHLSRLAVEFPWWLGRMHQSVREFALHPKWGGGIIAFRNLNDPAKYLSAEFAAIAVDELTRNPQEVFDRLRMRLRWPGIERPKFLAATNPGGIGHSYVKQFWVDRKFPPELEPLAGQFAFVQARASDNPYLPASYAATLSSLPSVLRRAYLDGDWNVFEGQFFQEFAAERHTCTPFPIPETWTERRISVDFGYGAPWACLFYVRDEERWKRDKIVRWYAYREFYAAGVLDTEQARRISAAIAVDMDACPRANFVAFADPSMFSRKPMQNISVAEVYAQQGVPLNAAPNERILGWQRVRHYLAPQADGAPGLRFFTTCPKTITAMGGLVFDKIQVDDTAQGPTVDDHGPDSVRYFCMAAGPVDFRRDATPVTRQYSRTDPQGGEEPPEDDPFAMFGSPQAGAPKVRQTRLRGR